MTNFVRTIEPTRVKRRTNARWPVQTKTTGPSLLAHGRLNVGPMDCLGCLCVLHGGQEDGPFSGVCRNQSRKGAGTPHPSALHTSYPAQELPRLPRGLVRCYICSRPDLYGFPDGSVWVHSSPGGGDLTARIVGSPLVFVVAQMSGWNAGGGPCWLEVMGGWLDNRRLVIRLTVSAG